MDKPTPPEIRGQSLNAMEQGQFRFPFLKKAGHYTTKEWRQLIDSLWGPGVPTDTKLSVFDNYWNIVDQTWGGFPNLVVNWDSLKAVYRPLVTAGVSRGRFSGILTRLTRALNEWHCFTVDLGIDSTMGFYPDLFADVEYPNYPSFQYRPGLPVININILFFRTNFGAGLTPLPDSTAMVYSVMPSHPLGLQPGDVILGYDGIPWRQLIRELLDAELPILGGGNLLGSTAASGYHAAMISAGMNWGLFDTIDVVKYSTKDTLHYPTSLLNTISPPYHIATEQLPVKGVSFPDLKGNKLVSWGVVEGTAIGYVYVWDWYGMPSGETRTLFAQAVNELINQQKVQGLILDFRTNNGGQTSFANDGYAQLLNFDPTLNYSPASRVKGGPHLSFNLTSKYIPDVFSPGHELFDHPIAVLTGPMCGSAGDYNSFKIRFHPMVRFFGKRTNGAYTAYTSQLQYGVLAGPYFCRVDDASVYSNYNNEGFMIHNPFPVDEEVWLTQDGVAKGQDDVVNLALAWITSLTYAHDVAINRSYTGSHLDSVSVTATLTDSLNHTAALSAIVTDTLGVVRDSTVLYNDGNHGDGQAGDSVWGCRIPAPSDRGLFTVNLRTDDITQGTYRNLPNIVGFATAGPLTLDSVGVDHNSRGYYYVLTPYVRNNDPSFTVRGATVTLRCNDPWVRNISAGVSLPDLPPGARESSTSWVVLNYNAAADPTYFNLKAEISVGSVIYWTDSTKRMLTGMGKEEALPVRYALEQNYPNPFNPSTTIRYALPQRSHVTLTVFNILGQQVAKLVNETKNAGFYEVKFDGGALASGLYFYRLSAGDFVQTKKLLLLK
jgi:hypothetical protein